MRYFFSVYLEQVTVVFLTQKGVLFFIGFIAIKLGLNLVFYFNMSRPQSNNVVNFWG